MPTVYSDHPPGLAHARDTLRKMAQLARDGAHTFGIRSLATRITRDVPSKQARAELFALYQWVRDNVRYRNDPVGLEWLQSPSRTIKERAGDCDDLAILLAALAQTLGRPTRFETVGKTKRRPQHVYVQAQIPSGEWVTLDPVLEPPARTTGPRADVGAFGRRAQGEHTLYNDRGAELGATRRRNDRGAVPRLTDKQSRKRRRQLRDAGCKVSTRKIDSERVVLRECPPGAKVPPMRDAMGAVDSLFAGPTTQRERLLWQAVPYMPQRPGHPNLDGMAGGTTAHDRVLWQTVPYFPAVPPTSGYADPADAGRRSPPTPGLPYRSAQVPGKTILRPTRSGLVPNSPADGLGQVDPEIASAAAKAAKDAGIPGGELLADVGKAATIIAAGSAVPVVGTAVGAAVALAVVFGPKLFKGIAGAFKKRENPWPKRERKLAAFKGSRAEKLAATWGAFMLAEHHTRGGDGSTRRWARSATDRLRAQVERELPGVSAAERRKYVAAPAGLVVFRANTAAQLRAFIANQERLAARPPAGVNVAAVRAQLALAKQALAEKARPARRAPARRGTGLGIDAGKIAAELAKQLKFTKKQLADTTAGAIAIATDLDNKRKHAERGRKKERGARRRLKSKVKGARKKARPVLDTKSGKITKWVPLAALPFGKKKKKKRRRKGAAPRRQLSGIRPSISFSLGHTDPAHPGKHAHTVPLPGGRVVETSFNGWLAPGSPVLGQTADDPYTMPPGGDPLTWFPQPTYTLAAQAEGAPLAQLGVDAVAKHIRSRANKRPPGRSVPAVLTFQEWDAKRSRLHGAPGLTPDGEWGTNTRTAAAWYLGVPVGNMPPMLPAFKNPLTWRPPSAKEAAPAPTPAPVVVAPPPTPAPVVVAPPPPPPKAPAPVTLELVPKRAVPIVAVPQVAPPPPPAVAQVLAPPPPIVTTPTAPLVVATAPPPTAPPAEFVPFAPSEDPAVVAERLRRAAEAQALPMPGFPTPRRELDRLRRLEEGDLEPAQVFEPMIVPRAPVVALPAPAEPRYVPFEQKPAHTPFEHLKVRPRLYDVPAQLPVTSHVPVIPITPKVPATPVAAPKPKGERGGMFWLLVAAVLSGALK